MFGASPQRPAEHQDVIVTIEDDDRPVHWESTERKEEVLLPSAEHVGEEEEEEGGVRLNREKLFDEQDEEINECMTHLKNYMTTMKGLGMDKKTFYAVRDKGVEYCRRLVNLKMERNLYWEKMYKWSKPIEDAELERVELDNKITALKSTLAAMDPDDAAYRTKWVKLQRYKHDLQTCGLAFTQVDLKLWNEKCNTATSELDHVLDLFRTRVVNAYLTVLDYQKKTNTRMQELLKDQQELEDADTDWIAIQMVLVRQRREEVKQMMNMLLHADEKMEDDVSTHRKMLNEEAAAQLVSMSLHDVHKTIQEEEEAEEEEEEQIIKKDTRRPSKRRSKR